MTKPTQQQNELLRLTLYINHLPLDSKTEIELRERIEAYTQQQVREAERRGTAFAVMVIDDLHMSDARMDSDTDKHYKGIKNTIRDKFKLKTGVDPAPNYPVKVTDAEITQPQTTKGD